VSGTRVIAITDVERHGWDVTLRMAERVCDAPAGKVVVLLRDYGLNARGRLQLGRQLAAIVRSMHQALWVADRLDVAALLDAQAIHLGQRSPSPERVSAARSEALLVQSSRPGTNQLSLFERWLRNANVCAAWHREEPLPRDVDALLVAPTAEGRKGRPPLSESGISELCHRLRVRDGEDASPLVFALGGVTSQNAQRWLRAGADGVAAIAAAYREPNALVQAALVDAGD
jgi:thiamine monophosphate synthase